MKWRAENKGTERGEQGTRQGTEQGSGAGEARTPGKIYRKKQTSAI